MNATATRSGFLPDRTIHLHPIGRCNLACLHCYAASSPSVADLLPFDLLRRALPVLRAEGYAVLSLSGGEPLIYPDLPRLIEAARSEGFRVVAISNGYRVRPALDAVLTRLHGLAISFDGMAAVHNRVRGQAQAFDTAVAALAHLAAIGVPAAAAYTVSSESLADTPEFVEMAQGLGARVVQLRPLVLAGRATAAYAGAALGRADLIRVYLMGAALAEAYAGTMAVHTDLAPSAAIAADRGAHAGVLTGAGSASLSDLVNPLVITPDGRVKPLTFDFPDAFDLGRIEDVAGAQIARLKARASPALGRVIGAALDAAARCDDFIDWFAFCRDMARAQASALPGAPIDRAAEPSTPAGAR